MAHSEQEQEQDQTFDATAEAAVSLGNQIANDNPDADNWEIASGLLAGAVQYWLYSRQPCGDPYCESCGDVATAEQRLRMLMDEVKEFAEESDYFHTANDANVGRA